jgi:RHS repeat-associated protein
LLYEGHYRDLTTGFYGLRARWYDPSTAELTGVDPDVADTGQPYAYAGGDPVNNTDPSGLTQRPNPASAAATSRTASSPCPTPPSPAWQCSLIAGEGALYPIASVTKEFEYAPPDSTTGLGFIESDITMLPGLFTLGVCYVAPWAVGSCAGDWDYAAAWPSLGYGLGPFVSIPVEPPTKNVCRSSEVRVTVTRTENPLVGVLVPEGGAPMAWFLYVYTRAQS